MSSGESLVKDIVGYSKNDTDPNRKCFYLGRYGNPEKTQLMVEYHKVSTDLNKTCQDNTAIVTEGVAYKFSVISTNNEKDPYMILETRSVNQQGSDICQLPVAEDFPGQYFITFINESEFKNDIKEFYRNLL